MLLSHQTEISTFITSSKTILDSNNLNHIVVSLYFFNDQIILLMNYKSAHFIINVQC